MTQYIQARFSQCRTDYSDAKDCYNDFQQQYGRELSDLEVYWGMLESTDSTWKALIKAEDSLNKIISDAKLELLKQQEYKGMLFEVGNWKCNIITAFQKGINDLLASQHGFSDVEQRTLNNYSLYKYLY
jgi:hypothetical protein